MHDSGEYLKPVFEGRIRFQKPILFYWLVLISYKILGVSLFSARIVSVIALALTSVIIYQFTKKIFSRTYALPSALLVSGNYICYLYGRAAQTDATLILFTVLSLTSFGYGYFEAEKRNRNIALVLFYSALAFSVKGGVALCLTILPIVVFCLFNRNPGFLKKIFRPFNLVVFLFISLWHYIYMFLHFREKFISHQFSKEVSARLDWSVYQIFHHLGYYIEEFLVSMIPFSILPLLMLPLIRRNKNKTAVTRYGEKELFLLCISLSIIGFFMIFVTKPAQRYILPAFPFIAILITCIYNRIILDQKLSRWIKIILSILFILILVLTTGITVLLFRVALIPAGMLIIQVVLSLYTIWVLVLWKKDISVLWPLILAAMLFMAFSEGMVRPYLQKEREKELISDFNFQNKNLIYYKINKSGRAIINLLTSRTLPRIDLQDLLETINYNSAKPDVQNWIIITKSEFEKLSEDIRKYLIIKRKTYRYNVRKIPGDPGILFDVEKQREFIRGKRDWIYLVKIE